MAAPDLMKVEKARLSLKSGTEGGLSNIPLQCHFNPKELTIAKGATWTRSTTAASQTAPPAEFKGTGPRTLTMELLFDDWEGTSGDVVKAVDTLISWTNPTPTSRDQHAPTPPIVVLQWGQKMYFESYLKQVSAKFTMFRKDGTPSRASANITLEETAGNLPMTNPTSGGVPGRKTRLLGAGDSLHSVAYQEYGDPKFWRALAATNGIDDPLRVPIGTTILVPPRNDVEDLA